LFFQKASDSLSAQIIGSSSFNTILQGAYYFPSATVDFGYSGAAKYNILVADRIDFGSVTSGGTSFSASTFNSDYTSLSAGSPIKAGAVLDE
jgi:hypothetical protein